ncbi:MAG: hypothetical protein M3011_08605 [Actinomycetota bacterium]|nr:hypothetical protein [Actinomycetota bacterium]
MVDPAQSATPNPSDDAYMALARAHLSRWCPQLWATLDDPDSYLSDLSNEVLARREWLTAHAGVPKELQRSDWVRYMKEMTAAQWAAESQALGELVYSQVEPEAAAAEEADPQT